MSNKNKVLKAIDEEGLDESVCESIALILNNRLRKMRQRHKDTAKNLNNGILIEREWCIYYALELVKEDVKQHIKNLKR